MRICHSISNHISYFIIWINFMQKLYSLCTGNQLMFCSIGNFLRIFGRNTSCHPSAKAQTVDFIECQPVSDLSLISFTNSLNIAYKTVNCSCIYPCTPFIGQSDRCFIMRECDKWFNTCLMACIKHSVIESKSFFIGFFFITKRKDSCPVNGHTICFKAHFTHQSNILFIMMIEVACLMAWIVIAFKTSKLCTFRCIQSEHQICMYNAIFCAICYFSWLRSRTSCTAVRRTDTFSTCIPASFILVGSCSTAP